MMERQYKDSGIEWIGRIPEEWKTCRLKDCACVVLGKMLMSNTPKGQETQYTFERYLKSKNIGWLELILDNGTDEMWFNQEEKNAYLLRDGDIVMNEGGDIGKVALWKNQPYDCYIQNSVHKITVGAEINNHFLLYTLYFASSKGYLKSIVNQISIAHLTKEKLQNTPITLPPLPEQQRIASYLDKKCGEIDELIALQEKMIAQLTEYKQAVITEAVTKGLDPNAKLVPSGIEWIGDVPEGWRVCRIKDIVNLQSGTNLTTMDISETGKYPVYGGNGIRGYYHEYTNEGEFILIGRQGALCGNINYASGKFWATEHAVVCYPQREFARKWLGELLRAMNLGQYSLSAAQPGLSVERIRNLYMPLPSLPEQHSISTYLDTKCSEIDTLITLKRQKIESLNAYKKSVIYEAVTGKTIIE